MALTLGCGVGSPRRRCSRPPARAGATERGRSACCSRSPRSDGAVGRLVGAARRELAGRRADARLQRRVRRSPSLLARAAPARWPAVLGGVLLAAVVVCGYALLTKVFPDASASHDQRALYARLQEPYGYWNAIGLTAAMGAIGCMWLGARRAGHALLSALAYPAMGLMLVTLMLAYSRGALAALALGAGAVAVPRAAAPARGGRAARRRARRGSGGRAGTSPGTRSPPTTCRSPNASAPGTSSACCSPRCCSC